MFWPAPGWTMLVPRCATTGPAHANDKASAASKECEANRRAFARFRLKAARRRIISTPSTDARRGANVRSAGRARQDFNAKCCGLEPKPQPAATLMRSALERQPRAELHLPRSALDGRVVAPVRRRRRARRIDRQTESGTAGIDCAHALRVRDVESFETQLHADALSDLDGLRETHIKRVITDVADDVAIARFARPRIAEALISGRG